MTQTIHFSLTSALTIETVESLSATLLVLAETAGNTITIDASRTDIITSPGLQMLHALGRSLESAGGHLLLHAPHASLVKAFADAGIQHNFFGESQ